MKTPTWLYASDNFYKYMLAFWLGWLAACFVIALTS